MYGLAQGITQGLQMTQQGMVQADDIRVRRKEMQMKEREFAQHMQQGQLSTDKTAQELEMVKLQLNEFKRKQAMDDTYKAFDAFEKSSDSKYINLAIQDNPDLASLVNKMGTTSFMNPNSLSEEERARLGITQEDLDNPASRIVVSVGKNGERVKTDLMPYYAASGYLPRLEADKLKAIETRAREAQVREAEVSAKSSELKLEDMEKYMEANPNATLADYMASLKSTEKTAIERNADYIREASGEEAAQEYIKKQSGMQEKEYSSIVTKEYEIEQQEAIKQEAGVDNLYDVDVNKLSSRNRTVIRQQAAEEAKQTAVKDDLKSFASIAKAADRLDIGNLDKTTGIIDASVKSIMDSLGMDLSDDVLINSSNYALIVNAFTRATFGSQVTGNELERIKKQLGTEFKADKTVKKKLAETLANAAESFSTYKTMAPALYATEFKPRVDRLREIAQFLRDDADTKAAGEKQKLETYTHEGVTYYKDVESGTWKELK